MSIPDQSGWRPAVFVWLVLFFVINHPLASRADDDRIAGKGNALYRSGKYAEALKVYDEGLARDPYSVLLNYNAGVSGYKLGVFDAAARAFEKSVLSKDKTLQAKAHYNLGNTKYAMASSLVGRDDQSAVKLMHESLDNYQRSIELDPRSQNAKFNFEYVTKEVKKLKEKIKQNPQCQDGNKDQDKKDSKQKRDQNKSQDQKQPQDKQDQDKSSDKQQQQDKQDQQNSQARQEPQDKNQQQESGAGQKTGPADDSKEMSQDEAKMLLDSYRTDERAGLLRDKDQGQVSSARKDW